MQSILVSELLKPSRRLWIVSPWITDIEVIDNSGRRFAHLSPAWESRRVRLSEFIESYLHHGSSVALIMNTDTHNDAMVRRLTGLQRDFGRRLHISRVAQIHAKGIVSDRFALTGSMNITYSGLHINSEHIDYSTDPAIVRETLEQFEEYLGGEAS